MKYDKQRKQRLYLGGKAFEIVNHDDPANAFLQESNSIADQKAVITHVEAHSDFFANNEWFHLFHENDVNAAEMIERHAERIESIIEDAEVDRSEVERWIDHLHCIQDNIDQHRQYEWGKKIEEVDTEEIDENLLDDIDNALDLTDEVKDEVFSEEWVNEQLESEDNALLDNPENDLLLFLYQHGMQYDKESMKAVEFEEWQRDIIEILREESYYFAPQRMTKVMNEGWAAFWESVMMTYETFANDNEFIDYSDHMARVLGSPGLNPYKLGLELWKYVENDANRREIVRKLLRVDGITWRNFHDKVDFEMVKETLEPDVTINEITSETLDNLDPEDPRVDSEAVEQAKEGHIDVNQYPWKVLTKEGLAERHFSLTRPENLSFLQSITQNQLEEIARYLIDLDRYDTIEEALSEVEYTAGWEKMRGVMSSHNDVTFLDEFLTQEFVDKQNYFTYEYSKQNGDYRATSTDVDEVKKKFLLQFTNFGKPKMTIRDGNFKNRGELLISHEYNGIALHIGQAQQVMERMFELWGRPVNLVTVVKEANEEELEIAKRRGREPELEARGKRVRYDGNEFSSFDMAPEYEDLADEIAATEVDYDTKPDDWLA